MSDPQQPPATGAQQVSPDGLYVWNGTAWVPNPSASHPQISSQNAKAQTKANRPWYKKKRWIFSIALVALIAIGAATSSGGSDPESDSLKASTDTQSKSASDSTSDSSKKDESKASDPVGSKDNPAPRGTAVQNKSAKYVVNSVEVKDSLGQFADPPAGKYVVVTLTAENVKDKTIQISSGDFTSPTMFTLKYSGGVKLSDGGTKVRISKLRADSTTSTVTAVVDGKRIKLFAVGAPTSGGPASGGITFSGYTVTLAPKAIKVLDKDLSTKTFAKHNEVGTGSTTVKYAA